MEPALSASQPAPAHLDLRGTPCPLNYVRSRLALETLPPGALLLIDLDAGEPEQMVSEGLRGEGHGVECSVLACGHVRLSVRRG